MKYILNVPKIPQQEFSSAVTIADALVAMKRAINPTTVADRIMQLGEADVMSFGNASVIAIADDYLGVGMQSPTLLVSVPDAEVKPDGEPINATPLTKTQELPQRVDPDPMTTEKLGRVRGK